MQCEEDWLVMHALYAQHGWSISKIAREFGVDWRTARRYATSKAVPRYSSRECPAELTEAQLAHVQRRLDRCQDLRATTLYRELQELGYQGSYPSLVRRVRTIRPRDEDTDPTVRFETGPGVQVQVGLDRGRTLAGRGRASKAPRPGGDPRLLADGRRPLRHRSDAPDNAAAPGRRP